MEFKYNTTEEMWDGAADVLAASLSTRSTNLKGMGDLREQWQTAKSGIAPLFDDSGRIIVSMDNVEIPNLARDEFRKLRQNLYANMGGTEISKFLGLFTFEEIVENRVWYPHTMNYYEEVPRTENPKYAVDNLTFFVINEQPIVRRVVKHVATEKDIGMKFSKCASRFITDNDKREVFLKYYSLFLGSIKSTRRKATMVISINPVDLLTTSVDKWRSCHHIYDGEFRAGNLAYMVDKYTAVCYLTTGFEEFTIGNRDISIPRKLWRQLVYIDLTNGIASFRREYPQEFAGAADAAREVLGNALAAHHNVEPPKWTRTRSNVRLDVRNRSELGYVDSVTSEIYVGHKPSEMIYITVLDYPLCPKCGNHYVSNSGSLSCTYCGGSGYYNCESCGCGIDEGDEYEFEGSYYCEECYHDLVVQCDYCSCDVLRDDTYQTAHGEFVCVSCADNHTAYCNRCGELYYNSVLQETTDGQLYCSSCYGEVVCSCAECGAEYAVDHMEYDTENSEYYCTYCGPAVQEARRKDG